VLSGHLHLAARIPGRPAQVIAPTALSPRRQGVAAGWVLLRLGDGPLEAELREATPAGFAARAL